jgi:mannose-1-phosphate guanylyltransferase
MEKSSNTIAFAPVILAGGSGTRFWPRSRRARPKQVLALDGESTMIQQTVARLLPLASAGEFWVLTNGLLRATIAAQLPELNSAKILCEPEARNTAPACALAAFLLERTAPETVLGVFPSDSVVQNEARFVEVLSVAIELAAAGDDIVVLGVPPAYPETGYGYIELGETVEKVHDGSIPVRSVKRFTEKPDRATAEKFLAAKNYAWNSGVFLWKASTLAGAIRRYVPAMVAPLEKIAKAYGTPEFERVFAEEYAKCESISVDYAVLEPVSLSASQANESKIYCLPADFAWNDIGSWAALHEHKLAVKAQGSDARQNVIEASRVLALDASGNYVFAPGKTVALVGVENLVVVETDDALLITTRENSQRVGEIVKKLAAEKQTDLI